MTAHTCHAEGCPAPCRPEHLMCRKHWSMVPQPLQTAVYNAYAPGQCDDGGPAPSAVWLDAARHAIAAVAGQEGRPYRRRSRLTGETIDSGVDDR